MISIVAAMSENRAIGRDNHLPWNRISADLKRFKSLTLGHHLIVGRRTYDSVGKPLPGRINVVVTRHPADVSYPPEVKVAANIAEAVALAKGDEEIFIGGGAEIYRQALALTDRIYLTVVHASLPGDTFFPEFDEKEWNVIATAEHGADEKNEYAVTFIDYERKKRRIEN